MDDLFCFDSFPTDVELSNELLFQLDSDLMVADPGTTERLFPHLTSKDRQTYCPYGVVKDMAGDDGYHADYSYLQQHGFEWEGMADHHLNVDWTIPESKSYRMSSKATRSPTENVETRRPSREVLTPTADTSSDVEKGARLSQDSVTILRNWWLAHQHQPCPSKEQQERLRLDTGLSDK
ncbi:hypothetical protein MMC26_002101 [Xylographa opegraphella]|nr:hypothetical protein [Xylographa opegraphella]